MDTLRDLASARVQLLLAMIHAMKRKARNPALPVHDYRPALQCAVSWLGDRYLLAEPVRRTPERKPFFAETRRWFPSTRQ